MGERAETDPTILLVEDNPGDVRLIEEALQEPVNSLYITRNGREALDFLHRRNEFSDAPRPDVVLLDLNLPKVDGGQVLDEIRSDPDLAHIRVVVITSARAEHTALEPGAINEEDFITKPADPDEFLARVRTVIFD
ncbi:receiver box response regulator (plasmid) [Natrialba magadii ATCC 43099]|uniref:Receiver box response regulator n=1 Tax=Natrialba magadii (strain ATCC 43099 / DSM 3394 / CCM 3739 / CIP 104546 / IAM 13178 / JCM 8861 / NBRC 102185 / NCIMB 2190 / MS3) TaxID=547559 RepID=D3T0W6_NATMM|nr:response regulator [Natrialba magadii]ADD07225.1 receiver box response regulator [Natrialba magadii ATCC 43099]ELY34337.1 response regulator receiver protein [Natrialba magadii ATCC 43099]